MDQLDLSAGDGEYGFKDLCSMLSDQASSRSPRPALIWQDRVVTWQELARRITRLAAGLTGLGVEPGDRVAVLARTSPEYVEVLLGALRCGACIVPLPEHLARGSGTAGAAGSAVLGRMLRDSDARVLALSAEMRSTLAEGDLDQLLPGGRIGLDFEAPGWVPLGSLASASAPLTTVAPEAPFDILYSSGTTGEPKGIVHSHRARWFQVRRMERLGLGPEAVTLIATPLCSNTTLVALLPTLALGGTAVLISRFTEEAFLELAERHRVTHTMMVPVQYRRLLDHPRFERHDLGAFVLKLCTGAPLSVSLKRALLERWPGELVEIYGLTEGGATTLLRASDHLHDLNRLGSVGRPAIGIELRILDPEGNALPPGKPGEIAGRAVSMMSGYHKRPDLTEAISWRDDRGRVFLRTGDLGWLDEDGYLHLVGRAKEVIISGGQNIHTADLERVLAEHQAVAETAVIGIPSQRWGETPLALVVLRPGQRSSGSELLDWANSRLPRAQRLAGVELREELPRNAGGKVLKEELRAPFWRERSDSG
jgi:acyl-CoA synthetase (AMP-forming)/AMP-acid ligase II